jgi:hypothetical protein
LRGPADSVAGPRDREMMELPPPIKGNFPKMVILP